MSEQPKNIESAESSDGVELSVIREPEGHYGFVISIRGSATEAAARAYNRAAEKVLKANGLHPFHELSTERENQPGVHYWEIPREAPATREQIESLLPQIQAEAQASLNETAS